MYKIIGADKKEYGPVSADQMHRWISEGRANAQTLAQAVGNTDWKPLGQFPEFADSLRVHLEPLAPPPLSGSAAREETLSEADYDLDLGECIGNGWNAVKNNFGILFGGMMIYVLIIMCISALSSIPVIGILVRLGNLVISGPLIAGLFYLCLQTVRGRSSDIGLLFSGFSRAFLQLFLGYLVMGLLIGLCMVPAIIVVGVEFSDFFMHLHDDIVAQQPFAHFHPTGSQLALSIAACVACAIPVIYLQICWQYALVLIIDRQINFSDALRLSRKRVSLHWWLNFGLVVLVGLLNIAGGLACCVGLLVTAPIGLTALMIAYECIFFGKGTQKT